MSHGPIVTLSLACILAGSPSYAQSEKPKPRMPMTNPLLAPWTGPHGGSPAFSKVRPADFEAAFDAAMDAKFAELNAIANRTDTATFANTFAALERAGRPMSRLLALWGIWSSNLSTEEVRKMEGTIALKLANFENAIAQNEQLFMRISAAYDNPENTKLTPEQQRVMLLIHKDFQRRGANLCLFSKNSFGNINNRLAELETKVSQNVLADEEQALIVSDQAELQGLSPQIVASAAAEAKRRGEPGKWAFANTRSAIEPLLVFADNRALRERAFKLWTSRGDMQNEHNNNATIVEILKERQAKARLLGQPDYATWRVMDNMAKKPQAAMDLLMQVWRPAVVQFGKELAAAQEIATKDNVAIAPWDFRYYAEKVRKERYDFDFAKFAPYLTIDNLQRAMFWMANELYGFTFEKLNNVQTFHPDVTVYAVKQQGKPVGLWFFDPYARQGKRSGAWMTTYRDQSTFDGPVTTIVSNNSNFIKSPTGVTTVSWDDARTMFHEFGHALHGLASKVAYPRVSGTNTPSDFVEFPSQFHENFILTPQVLKFFVNAKGEKIPAELIERLLATRNFGSGFSTVETLSSAIVDMRLHTSNPEEIEPKAFEAKVLAEIGMPKEVVMRHRIPAFLHIFSSEDGYAAGYYSYLWSEVLSAQAYEVFESAPGGPYDKQVSKKFLDTILSVGDSVSPHRSFRNFTGEDPDPKAYMREKGFVKSKKDKS